MNMEKERLFRRHGLNPPGKINTWLDGHFQTVRLDDLPDDKLKQLYENKCPYVQPTQAGRKVLFPDEKSIEVTTINFKKISEKQKVKK